MLQGGERTNGYAEFEAIRLSASCYLREMDNKDGPVGAPPPDLNIRITVTAQSTGKTGSARTTVIFRTTMLE